MYRLLLFYNIMSKIVTGGITLKEKILALIKNCEGYISGEELSSILGITRSAVWKYIKALKEDGYIIDSVTNKGYCLKSCGNVLNEIEVADGLKTKYIGNEIIFLKKVDSTNEEIKRHAAKDAEEGLVAVAEQQLLGKGRLGRAWTSPKGTGLWFSILLRPEISPYYVAGITLASGLAVCKAIREFTGCNAKIKWPNDVICGNKKICGILTEMTAEADKINYVVVGIGINVNTTDFPVDIENKATSLYIETGEEIPRAKLLQKVLAQFENYIEMFLDDSQTDAMLSEYVELCATIDRTVSTVRNNTKITGKAIGIGKSGELKVRLPDGQVISVTSGEVTVQGIY